MRAGQYLLRFSSRVLWRDGAERPYGYAALPASPAAAYAVLNDESLAPRRSCPHAKSWQLFVKHNARVL
jgi:hypothetical protein